MMDWTPERRAEFAAKQRARMAAIPAEVRSAMMREIARLPRRPQTPEHRAKISEGVRRAQAEGKRRRSVIDDMTDREAAEYRFLTKQHIPAAEALRIVRREP